MTTQPKPGSEPRQSNQNHHGPFYRSAELVAGVHHAEGGIFEGFRGAHAFGRIYAGTFTATPVAKTLSRAAHFQGNPVTATARLSGSSGDPEKNKTKYREEAYEKFGVNWRGFDRAWDDAILESGNTRWRKSGRKPRRLRPEP